MYQTRRPILSSLDVLENVTALHVFLVSALFTSCFHFITATFIAIIEIYSAHFCAF